VLHSLEQWPVDHVSAAANRGKQKKQSTASKNKSMQINALQTKTATPPTLMYERASSCTTHLYGFNDATNADGSQNKAMQKQSKAELRKSKQNMSRHKHINHP